MCFGTSSGVTKVAPDGTVTRNYVSGLVSGAQDGEAGGASDVAIAADGSLYISVGLGANQELRDGVASKWAPAAMFGTVQHFADGKLTTVFDVTAWEAENDPSEGQPSTQGEEGENSNDSNPNGILVKDGMVYVADAGGNFVLRIDPATKAATLVAFLPDRMAELPPFFGAPPGTEVPMQAVPTSLALDPDGNVAIGQLTGFPFPIGGANVHRVDGDTSPAVVAEGFTNIMDLGYRDGELFALEIAHHSLLAPEDGGALVRVRADGSRIALLRDTLMFPGGMAVGPDGMVYITNGGVFPGGGTLLRFDPSQAADPATQMACPPDDVPGAGLSDIADTTHEENIVCAAWWGLFTGGSDGTFQPAASISRGQFASVVARLVEASGGELDSSQDAFDDDDGTTHETAINGLAAAGIVGGFADGTFRSGDPGDAGPGGQHHRGGPRVRQRDDLRRQRRRLRRRRRLAARGEHPGRAQRRLDERGVRHRVRPEREHHAGPGGLAGGARGEHPRRRGSDVDAELTRSERGPARRSWRAGPPPSPHLTSPTRTGRAGGPMVAMARQTRSVRPARGLLLPALVLAALSLPASAASAASPTVIAGPGGALRFSPSTVTIEAGDTVVWRNDSGSHNVAGDGFTSGPPSGAAWTYSHTFPEPGTYAYLCQVHYQMKGTVTVTAASTPAPEPEPEPEPTTPAPTSTPAPPPPSPTAAPATATPAPASTPTATAPTNRPPHRPPAHRRPARRPTPARGPRATPRRTPARRRRPRRAPPRRRPTRPRRPTPNRPGRPRPMLRRRRTRRPRHRPRRSRRRFRPPPPVEGARSCGGGSSWCSPAPAGSRGGGAGRRDPDRAERWPRDRERPTASSLRRRVGSRGMIPDALPADADTVLLDVGGVLFVDPWETVLLTTDVGLVTRYGLDRRDAETAARALWPEFATREATEAEYWERLGQRLGVRFDPAIVEDVAAALLCPLPTAGEVLALVEDRRAGVITDNTAFWYPRQRDALGLDRIIDPELEFVSFRAGVRKRDRPGLFDVAAERCDPARTVVIDDRWRNLDRASALGFHVREVDARGS